MNSRANTDDYRQLFLSDTPLLDVRAPVEFDKGAFPSAQNIPLLDDQQRELIGTRYKEQGQDAAIALGWQLATPEVKAARIEAWQAYAQAHPEGFLYCFRGGLRSRMSQQLIAEAGINYPFVEGGYKAMRRFLIDELDRRSSQLPLTLISGRTGSGKTLVIQRLSRALDLEGLAKHRGSAFGRQLTPQPAQIDFENQLSIAVLKQQAAHDRIIFAEDEGKIIGQAALPLSFVAAMKKAPLAILETPLAERVDIALADYVTDALPQYLTHFGDEEGPEHFRQQILGNLARIKKRLGGDRYQQLEAIFSEATDEFLGSGCADAFRPGIEILLHDYYDPMYDYQQSKREGKVLFRGEQQALIDWAEHYSPPS